MKKLMAALIAGTLCLALFGCSLSEKNTSDPTTVVVSIGDEKADLAAFKALYDNYLPYMQYYGQDPLSSAAALESFQDWILDSLTNDLVTRYQAKEAGFKLTDEQEEELKKQTDEEIKTVYDRLMKYAEQSFADDPDTSVETYFDGLVNSESEYYTGVALGWEDYKAYYEEQARDAYIVKAYKEFVCREFEPTEADVRSWYESACAADKANYEDSPEKYRKDEELYETSFGVIEGAYPITYVPDGYSRMMHIIVTPEGELSDEYVQKLDRMEQLKAEYGELAFSDALSGQALHAQRLQAILDEYSGLKSETDTEFDSFVAGARNKIYMAYGELEEGKPFAEVMLKYTEDERVVGRDGTGGCEAFREKGELISTVHNGPGDWSETIKSEFAKLVKGTYSKVFMDGGSYHIIYYASDEKAGVVGMDSIYDDIKSICLDGVQGSQWEALLEEWKNDPELKVNMDLVRSVGVGDLKENDERADK